MSSVDVRAVVHDVLGSHGDETILDYIVGEFGAGAGGRWLGGTLGWWCVGSDGVGGGMGGAQRQQTKRAHCVVV